MDLNQVTLPASDMKASIKFYQTLGLNLIVQSHSRYARFEAPDGDATLSIHLAEEGTPPSTTIVYFEVADVAGTVKNLEAKGIVFEQQPTDQAWLWREAHLKDPFGNPIIIYFAGKNRKTPPWRLE